MNGFLRVALLIVPAVVYAASGSPAAAQGACSLSTLNGSYGFAASGFVPVTGASGASRWDPFALLGLVKFDGAGNVSVAGRTQTKGGIASSSFTGKYTVSATCTGAAEFNDEQNHIVMRWEFVVTDSGAGIETLALFPRTGERPLFSTNFHQRKL